MRRKHTPGPWKYGESMLSNDNLYFVGAANGSGICECFTEANALLIAAAPQLLEALELLHARCGKVPTKAWKSEKEQQWFQDAYETASTVLAKVGAA